MNYSPRDGKHIEAILFEAYGYGIHQEVSLNVAKYLVTHDVSAILPRAHLYEAALKQEYFKKYGTEFNDIIIY